MNHFGSDERARLRALCEAATPGPECTGISARWCPRCGDCACPDGTPADSPLCPLHARGSSHGEDEEHGPDAAAARALGEAARTAIPALLDDLDLAEHEDGFARARIARMEARRNEARTILGAGEGVCYETLVDAARRVVAERDAARAEVLLARVGGVSTAFAGQSSREADAVQWGATVGERDALRAENTSLRERVAALEALVGIVP